MTGSEFIIDTSSVQRVHLYTETGVCGVDLTE